MYVTNYFQTQIVKVNNCFIHYLWCVIDFQIRKALVEITALPVYDVRLIRDKLTNTSRGFCFVELGSVEVHMTTCNILSTLDMQLPYFLNQANEKILILLFVATATKQ